MNDKIARIMAKKVCPKCRSKIERDVHVPRFGGGKNVIKWRCTNDKCDKSVWNILPRRY